MHMRAGVFPDYRASGVAYFPCHAPWQSKDRIVQTIVTLLPVLVPVDRKRQFHRTLE